MDVENNEVKPQYTSTTMGVRHLQVFMYFAAVSLGLCMRVNMSIAIVDMTDSTKNDYFTWSIQTQSIILSSFFWGYIVLQLPSGELAARYGGKLLLLVCMAGNSLVLILIPLAAYCGGWKAVCACRITQGVLQGLLLPSVHGLIAKWVPLNEKSCLGMFLYSGCPFGIALQLMISGFIAHSWGWPAVFYVGSAMGFLWTLIYGIFGADSPDTSRFIRDDERKYILESLGQLDYIKAQKIPTPWAVIWTSPAFISLIVAHVGSAWGMWTLMTEIPTYISKVLGVNIRDNGILSALPYITMTLMGFPFGYISNFLVKYNFMTITGSRKLCNTIAYFGAATALIILSHAPVNITVAVVLLSIAVGLTAGYVTGFFLVHLDMAPNFAGTMMGITNGVSSLTAIFGPLAAGAILKTEANQSEWRKLFYLTAATYVLTNLTFIIFGTSERQPWNEPLDIKPPTNKSTENETPKVSTVENF